LSRKAKKPTVDGWEKAVEGVKQEKVEIVVKPKTKGQERYIAAIAENSIIFCDGPAGSGKTFLSVGIGLQMLMEGKFKKIVFMRPAIEAYERIGYLPGSATDKLFYITSNFFSAAECFLRKTLIESFVTEGKIEIVPMGFLRGRTFNNTFCLIDEGENLLISQTLLTLTRLGEGSKMVFNGDLMQSDLKERNGLQDAFTRLQDIPGIGFVELDSSDIVRHPLISTIIDRYSNRNHREQNEHIEPVVNDLKGY